MKNSHTITLKNGVTVIIVPKKEALTTTVLVGVRIGSNNELEGEYGLAHFLEHMCFKGTKRYPGTQSFNIALDSLGADTNAFTSNEYTAYYLTGTKKQTKKLLNFASDIFLNPILPKEELEKERGVILQEIAMYEDDPCSKAYELCEELLFKGTPAGRRILGTVSDVKSLKHKYFLQFRDTHYVGSNTMVIIVGDCNPSEIKKQIQKLFLSLPKGKKTSISVVSPQKTKTTIIHTKKNDQANIVLGFPFGHKKKDKYVLAVLSTLLGSGFSSRLNTRIREEMGACYGINAFVHTDSTYGAFYIHTSVAPKNVKVVLKAIKEELKSVCNTAVTKEELEKVKNYIRGLKFRSVESTHGLAYLYFRNFVHEARIETPKEYMTNIQKITSTQLQKAAKTYLDFSHVKISVVGNIKEKSSNITDCFTRV